MNKVQNNSLNAFDAVIDLLEGHPITPAIPRLTALSTQLGTLATTLRTHAAKQIGGRLLVRSGTSSRAELAVEVKKLMQPINRIARALDREAHPGVRDQFRMPANQRYETLIATARAFVTAMEAADVKTLFTDRGLAAIFDTELSSKVDELVAITEVKNNGVQGRSGATEGIRTLSSSGLKIMREMEAILKVAWANDPVMLGSLQSACHVERPPKKKKAGGTSTESLVLSAQSTPVAAVAGVPTSAAPETMVV